MVRILKGSTVKPLYYGRQIKGTGISVRIVEVSVSEK